MRGRTFRSGHITGMHNHRTVGSENGLGRDLKDHLIPKPLSWSGIISTRQSCPKSHSASPWTLPWMGHPYLRTKEIEYTTEYNKCLDSSMER